MCRICSCNFFRAAGSSAEGGQGFAQDVLDQIDRFSTLNLKFSSVSEVKQLSSEDMKKRVFWCILFLFFFRKEIDG